MLRCLWQFFPICTPSSSLPSPLKAAPLANSSAGQQNGRRFGPGFQFHTGFVQHLAECAVTWVHLHSGASAVEGCEPDKEHKADFAGKLRLHVCLHPAPLVKVLLGRSCSFLPATCALLPAVLHRRTVSGLSHPLEEADVWFRSREGCMFVVSLGLCFRGCFGPW